MRFKKGIKKVTSLVLATAMAVGLVVTGGGSNLKQVEAATTPDVSSAINYSTILGRAVDYGIVAKNFYQNMHMETTLATVDFWNLSGSSCDPDMAGTEPVHYIVGAVNQGALFFNDTAQDGPMVANVETTQDVINNSNKNEKTGIYADNGFTGNGGTLVFKTQTKAAITSNVENIINHGVDESNAIISKIATKGVDVDTVRDTSNTSKYIVDLTDDSYDGKVVYLDVKADNTDFLKAIAGTGDFEIKKHSDTVVVFNVNAATNTNLDGVEKVSNASNQIDNEDAEQLKFGKHNIYTVENGLNKAIDTETHWNGAVDQHDADVDSEVAQKIIWNLPNASRVSLNTSAGLFLATKEDVLVTLDNQAAGWVIANGTFKNNAEFHYVHQGRNATTNTDKDSMFHFALKKAFTHSYTDVKKDTTFDLDEGQYNFALYESNESFDTVGSQVGTTVSNMETNKVKLPDINITSDGTYYYIIKEEAATNAPEGVTISDGEIDIKVVVEKKELTVDGETKEAFYSTVDSKYYLTAADKSAGKTYKTNTGIEVSGLEFSLGDFYNLLSGSLIVEKKVTGDYTPASGEVFTVMLKDADGKYYNTNGQVVSGDDRKIEVPANGKVTFEGLPDGTYTVVEDGDNSKEGYKLTTSYVGNDVAVDGGSLPTIKIINNYESLGKLSVSKTVTGDNSDADGQVFGFKVLNITTNKYVVEDFETGAISYVDSIDSATEFNVTAGGDSRDICGLSTGDYKVKETKIPDYSSEEYTLTTTYNPVDGVHVDGESSTPVTISINNDYKAPKGTITIHKTITIDGKTVGYGSDQINPELITDFYNGYKGNVTFKIGDDTYTLKDFNNFTGDGTMSKEVLVGEYTVSETSCPNIIYDEKTYVVSTTVDGEVGNTKTVTVENNGTVTVDIVNAYTEQSEDEVSLTVNKNLNISGYDDTLFKFKVKVASGDDSGKYVKLDASSNEISYVASNNATEFEVSKNTPKVINGLKKAKYTIEETEKNIEGYTLASSSKTSVDVDLSEGNDSGTLVNDYDEITTDVVISKKTSGGDELAGAILTLTSKDGNTISDSQVTLGTGAEKQSSTSSSSYSWKSGTTTTTVKGLSNGEYTLHEDTAPAGYGIANDITFYVYNGKVYSDASHTTELSDNTVTMIDVDLGKLTVTKKTTGDVPAGYTTTYKFTVKTDDKKYVTDTEGTIGDTAKEFEVTANNTTGVVINNLDISKKYTVEEVTPADLGEQYECTTTYSPNATVEFSETDKEKSVEITNTFTQVTGSITVSKVEAGDVDGSNKPTSYSFYIKSGNQYVQSDKVTLSDTMPTTPFTVTTSASTTIDGLLVGRSYTIEEAQVTGLNDGYSCEATYAYGSDGASSISLTKSNNTGRATITNTYTKEEAKGSLTLKKTAENSSATSFTFYVKGADNKWYSADGTASDTQVGITVTAGETGVKISDLPLQKYTVTEENAEGKAKSGYEFDSDNSTTNGDCTLSSENKEGTVTLVNKYKKIEEAKGSLTITKNVTLNNATTTTTEVDGTYKFTVKDSSGAEVATENITISGGRANSVTIDNLAPGTYTVSEDTTGFTAEYSVDANDKTVTVESDATAGVTFTNNKTVDTPVEEAKATIKITKTISGPITEEDRKGLTFTVYKVDGTTETSVGEYKLSDFTENNGVYEKEISVEADADNEVTYKVVETLYTFTGKTVSVSYTVDNGTETSGDTAKVSVYKDDTKTVAFKDEYTNLKKEVSISKVDATNSEEIEGAELTLYEIKTDGSLNKLTDWTSSATEVYKFTLEAGDYAIEETIAPDGYEKSTSLVKFNLSFDEDGNAITKVTEGPGTYDSANDVIKFENDPIKVTGGLKITVLEEGTKRVVPGATVEVEAPEGETFPDGSTKITVTTDSNGEVNTFIGKDGEEYKLTEGLTPGGYKITVTKVPDGYKVTTGKTETVTVEAGKVKEHIALIATATSDEKDTPSTETNTPNTTTTPNKQTTETTPNKQTTTSTPNKDTTVVNTGDSMNVVPIIVVMVISLIASIIVIIRKRKMRYEY